ncbi:MAG: RrF2 family transcriptional regulator [Elusimicrobiota bacterium]
MLLTKETDYGIRALINLSSCEEEYKSVRKISEEEDIPYIFLRRIFYKLKNSGFIKTKGGAGGGAALNRKAGDINLGEIAKSLQGNIGIVSCMFKKDVCKNTKTCPLRKKLRSIQQTVLKELGDISIEDIRREN